MKEIRLHGRGGQGVVVASEILADAALREGKHVQSFPSFGPERRGAPVTAFARIDDKPIRLRCQIYEPDYVVVLDSKVCQFQDVTSGLKTDGVVLVNSPLTPTELNDTKLVTKGRVYAIDATSIALEVFGSPVLNTVMLGAFSAVTKEVRLDSLFEAVRDRFPESIAERNVKAMAEAHKRLETQERA